MFLNIIVRLNTVQWAKNSITMSMENRFNIMEFLLIFNVLTPIFKQV